MDEIPRNESFNQTDSPVGTGNTQLIETVQLLVYALIATVGLVGNAAICTVILTRKKRKISEYFILNLAVADLTTCVVSIPLDMIERLSERWPYGRFGCKLVYPAQTILMAVSVATLLAMSLERHRAIMHPLKLRMDRTLTQVVIALIWIGSLLLVSPYIHVLSYQDPYCLEDWPGNDAKSYARAFTLSVFVILYALPILGISVAYARVCMKLYKDINSEDNVLRCSGSSHERRKRTRRNIRIIRVFATAVTAFATCMLPNHLVWIWKDFDPEAADSTFAGHLLITAQILVYANSAINPFVFGTLHIRFTCCRRLFGRARGDAKPAHTSGRRLTTLFSFSNGSKNRSTARPAQDV